MKSNLFALMLLIVAAFVIGCSQGTPTDSHRQVDNHANDHGHAGHHDHDGEAGVFASPVDPSDDGKMYVLDSEPSNAQSVIDARKSVNDQDDIVLTGMIGGSKNPWIEGRAAFTLVDESLKSCNQIPGDNCPAPWDYCCETHKLKDASVLVKVVDETGQPIKSDARELLGVRELTQVVVKGKASRDDAGNLTVLASNVFVKKH